MKNMHSIISIPFYQATTLNKPNQKKMLRVPKTIVLISLVLLATFSSVNAFTMISHRHHEAAIVSSSSTRKTMNTLTTGKQRTLASMSLNAEEEEEEKRNEISLASVANGVMFLWTPLPLLVVPSLAMAAAADEVEIAELPPPYVPILVAFGLFIGVGLLTQSLGDVMGEEAALGDMSGARAKKEMERSRSSYFKK